MSASRIVEAVEQVLASGQIESGDLFAIERETFGQLAKCAIRDEKIRLFLAATVLESMANRLEKAPSDEAGLDQFRYALALICKLVSAPSLSAAEAHASDLVDIVAARSRMLS